MSPGRSTQFTSDQLSTLLSHLAEVDGVELKVTVSEPAQRSALAALGVDPLNAQIRQVFFLDTPALDLDRVGIVVRARRVQGRDGDTVLKMRSVDPRDLSEEWRRAPGSTVEIDAMPGGHVCSASIKHSVSNADVRRATFGEQPWSSLFSPAQRELFAERSSIGVGLDALAVLGPVFVLKSKLPKKELGRKMVVEMWLYPDGSRVLELSTKCRPSEALPVAMDVRAFLARRGVEISREQQTKTRRALEFFAAELTASGAVPAVE